MRGVAVALAGAEVQITSMGEGTRDPWHHVFATWIQAGLTFGPAPEGTP